MLSFFYTLLSVNLFIPVIAGLHLRRVASPEALGAIAAGISLATLVQVSTAGTALAGLTPAMWGLAGAALACASLTALRRRIAKPAQTTGVRRQETEGR